MFDIKNKIIIICLSLFICFSSINFSFAYNDKFSINDINVEGIDPLALPGVLLAPELIATIATIAVGSGIVLNSADDIYDIARIFYDNQKDNWEVVETLFNASVTIGKNKVVNVGKDFLDLLKSTFDSIFPSSSGDIKMSNWGVPYFPGKSHTNTFVDGETFTNTFGDNIVSYKCKIFNGYRDVNITYMHKDKPNVIHTSTFAPADFSPSDVSIGFSVSSSNQLMLVVYGKNKLVNSRTLDYQGVLTLGSVDYDLPYTPGTYDWDNIGSKSKEDGSVGVYVPGNAGSLPGVVPGDVVLSPGDVLNPPYDLPIDGTVDLPVVDIPSIGVGDSVTIPGEGAIDPPINPPIDTPFPPFPSFGNSLDFSPMYLTGVTEKFPFSLPWDIGRLINKFDVEPKAPIFELPLVDEKISLDLTIFDEWANIGRFFILIGFVLSLILISTKLLG